MKKCRCCHERWPVQFFTVIQRIDTRIDGRRVRRIKRRASCLACRTPARVSDERRRKAIERTAAYRAQLRADVWAVRAARAA